ncbi:MAG: hypothetical protein K2X49_21240, partial [Acetobacteraceae bacterium]|nr:hypothetical protein [Acetobacteraceae bacterium]
EPAGAAAAGVVPARPGAVWDGRFRLTGPGAPTGHGVEIGALGGAVAVRLRRHPGIAPHVRHLPASVLAALPAVRLCHEASRGHSALAAVPALLYPDPSAAARYAMILAPVTGPVSGTGT